MACAREDVHSPHAPLNHASAVSVATPAYVSGKMSSWKVVSLRGTTKEMGSTLSPVSLSMRATSQRRGLSDRLGRKSAPFVDTFVRCSARGCSHGSVSVTS